MSIADVLNRLFTKTPASPFKEMEKMVKRMGYSDDGGSFIKEGSTGRTTIWISEAGVKIKVYSGGYGESDFMPSPILDMAKLKTFIRSNEL